MPLGSFAQEIEVWSPAGARLYSVAKLPAAEDVPIGGVPTVMWRIVEADTFGQYDLSSVTRIGYGGAPAAPELVERIKAAFPQVRSSWCVRTGLRNRRIPNCRRARFSPTYLWTHSSSCTDSDIFSFTDTNRRRQIV